MRRVLLTLAIAGLGIAAAVGVQAPPARAACADLIVWHDTAYFALFPLDSVNPRRLGAAAPGAVRPACNDTGGPTPAPSPVGARLLKGVRGRVALAAQGYVFTADGYFPQSPGFPVQHRPMWHPDETIGCRVGAPAVLTGTALPAPLGKLDLHLIHTSRGTGDRLLANRVLVDLFVDYHTRFTGLERDGVPYVGYGQRLVIHAVLCHLTRGSKVVARTIAPTGPIRTVNAAEQSLGSGWRGSSDGVVPGGSHAAPWLLGIAAVALVGGLLVYRRRARSSTS